MEYVNAALMVMLIVVILIVSRSFHDRQTRIEIQQKVIADMLRARQSSVAMKRSSQGIPHVDSQARTVRRDTSDLPKGVRVGKLKTRRYDASANNDD